MRLFFALVPGSTLRAALGALGRRLAAQIGGRPVPAHNVHLTLAFLGEVDELRLPALRTLLDALPRADFTLTLDRIGEWRHASVVWIAPTKLPAALVALHAALAMALRDASLPIEERPFRPHLTLVRRSTVALAEKPVSALAWEVERVSLMRSDVVGGTVRYRELDGITLA